MVISGISKFEGITIGNSNMPFQDYLKSLKERGVILAVCSKNEKEKVILSNFR